MRVSREIVPLDSNIIGSHVIYRRKIDGTPKARIVPWEYKDIEKYDISGDAPLLNLDPMRLLLSLTAENEGKIRKMNVKSVYLQAKGFKRDVFVRSPCEKNEKSKSALWK